MEAKLSETDIQELLRDPEAWMKGLEENKERRLYDEAVSYHQKIDNVHRFYHEMKQLAEKEIEVATAVKANDCVSFLKTKRNA